MASFREITYSKRPHVKTERMQEFIRSQGEANSPTKKLKCPEACCNKVFTSSPGLKYHLQTHAVKDPQFSCKKCHKVFKSANGLKYHREKTKCDDTEILSSAFISGNHAQELGIQDITERPHITTRPTPRHLDLSLGGLAPSGGMDKLTELAIIATSPQSPLMQKPKPPWDNKPSAAVRSLEKMWDDRLEGVEEMRLLMEPKDRFERPTDVTNATQDGEGAVRHDGSDPRVSTSSPLCVSPEEEGSYASTWSHTWPTPVWQCFIRGTKIKFLETHVHDSMWQLAEQIGQKEELAMQAAQEHVKSQASYAIDGLCVKSIVQARGDIDQSEVEIHFSPGLAGQSDFLAICQRDHPFFVKDKGWSSIYPCETVVHYGIPCGELSRGDICLPPSHSDAAFSEEIFKSFEEFDFTPEDTSAVLALSSMKQRKESDLSPKAGSVQQKPIRGNLDDSPTKAKRPMNAFLLFAKDFRLGYTQKFPKRDNRVDRINSGLTNPVGEQCRLIRQLLQELSDLGLHCLQMASVCVYMRAISVMLGEQWKQLSVVKKQVYEERAKQLADKQKKMHPDCWKRKK